ncbi:EamA family transporter [Rhodobacterales bacterium HKCCE2091]|nr:EamA family transporter [Rhodobacterales bacterium HKCCE2091]
MTPAIPARDLAMILVVVVAWGSNFTAMKIGLEELPPFLFVGLRFAVLVPLIAVIPRPAAPWRAILGVGLFINIGQFAFLFSAMRADVTAGLASLLLQTQAPITILLSALFFGEAVTRRQALGIGIALTGLFVVGFGSGGSVTPLGLLLVLTGASSWAVGNLVLKRLRGVPMLPVFVWASLVPPVPMLALSWAIEDTAPLASIAALSPAGWGDVLYVAFISTVLGFSFWGALLARHPAARITPFALLIPVVGMLVAWLMLGERLSGIEAAGAAIILAGLALAVLRPGAATRPARHPTA